MKNLFILALIIIPTLSQAQYDVNADYKISGNVGIGTTTPGNLLHVQAPGGDNKVAKIYIRGTGQNNAGTLNNLGLSGSFISGTADDASFGRYNVGIESWYGIGFRSSINGKEGIIFDTRTASAFFQGNVGVGTDSPNEKLDVRGSLSYTSRLYKSTASPGSSDPALISAHSEHSAGSGGGELPIISLGFSQGISSGTDMDTRIWSYARNLTESRNFITIGRGRIDLSAQKVYTNGVVGIGTSDVGNHELAVEGSIGAREIKVEVSGWSDFVFTKDYDLRTLEEVEQHISENGHLPEIPSEAEVTENGINLGEMDSKLLMKIEELTLYMIDMNKQLQSQSERVQQLERENAKLKEKVNSLGNN